MPRVEREVLRDLAATLLAAERALALIETCKTADEAALIAMTYSHEVWTFGKTVDEVCDQVEAGRPHPGAFEVLEAMFRD